MKAMPVVLALAIAGCSAVERVVDPGDPRVSFRGHDAFSARTLEKEIERDLEAYFESPRALVLDDAVYRLTAFYRVRGYPDVAIRADSDGKRVVFHVDEGGRLFMGRVHVRGNDRIPDRELREEIEVKLPGGDLPFSEKLLGLYEEGIRSAYLRRGFLDMVVEPPRSRPDPARRAMNVTFTVREGIQYTLSEVAGHPEDPGLKKKLAGMLNGPYAPATPESIEAAVLEHLRNSGHPFGKVSAKPTIDGSTGRVVVRVVWEAGPYARFGALNIQGLESVRRSFVRDRAGLEKGRPYQAAEMREAERRLLETGLFKRVTVLPGVFEQESGLLEVEIRVEEAAPGEASVRAGYGSLDGFRIGGDVGYNNLFGGGELLRAGATASRIGSRLDVEGAVPWLLGTDLRLSVAYYYEDADFPSFEVFSRGLVPSLTYPWSKRVTTTLGGRYALVRTEDLDVAPDPEEALDFDYRSAFGTAAWDERDEPARPTRGFRLVGQGEWSPSAFGSDIQFLKWSGRVDAYAPLTDRVVLAVAFQAGVIAPLEETGEIPIALRYFAGGTTTVRGFEFARVGPSVDGEPVGGESYGALQAEVRFPIAGDFLGAVFTDRGGVWERRGGVDLGETRYSVGAGVRYLTSAGAIVLDFGWNPRRRAGEAGGAAHLSIGFPF